MIVVGLALFVMASPGTRLAQASRLEELVRTVETDRDEKARIAAAVGLGRLADPRAVPALVRALSDKSPVVRGVAATALGHLGDKKAVPALERTLSDPNEVVRGRARAALAKLRPTAAPLPEGARVAPKERPRLSGPAGRKQPQVAVKSVGDQSKKAGRDLPKRMKSTIERLLDESPQVARAPETATSKPQYLVDASITDLSRANAGPWVEVSCQVRIAVSTPEGKILSIVTGNAKVQTPRRNYQPRMERGLQADALENAVRGAFENLLSFVSRQVAIK